MSNSEPPARELPRLLSLEGKSILVTGAASGLGFASAMACAQLGADLVVTDRNPLDKIVDGTRQYRTNVTCLRGDLSDVTFLREEIVARTTYDGVIHSAGIFPKSETPEQENFDKVISINLRAGMVLANDCAWKMARRGGGRIVLFGSMAGRNGGAVIDNLSLNYAAYATSKAGLHTMTKWLARRVAAYNVLVNVIAPGVIDTPLQAGVEVRDDIFPMGRLGKAGEIGWPAAFLCTDAAGYITGTTIDINGGAYVAV